MRPLKNTFLKILLVCLLCFGMVYGIVVGIKHLLN